MNILRTLTWKLLLPPIVVLSLVAVYRFFQGRPVDLLDSIEGLGYLAAFVLAVWAPLPLVQRISDRVPPRWQSPVRLLLGVAAAAFACGVLILLLGKLGVI